MTVPTVREDASHRRWAWLALIAATVVLLFGSGTTFSSMGIPLFAMAQEFRWSQAAAGAAFLALGVVCAATSLGPMVLIPRIGARWTVVGGALLLGAGFMLASVAGSLAVFYAAAALFGIAFSLVANASGTYLVANWFGARADRMIGLYMMVGSLGAAVIPPLAGALTAGDGGWRFYWRSMAAVSLLIALFCALLIREPPTAAVPAADEPAKGWGYRLFLKTPQFLVLAAAMVGTQFCTVTVSAVAVPHFTNLGWSAEFAAQILGAQGLVGSIATGLSGWVTERHGAKAILVGALLLEAAGTLLLAFAHSAWAVYAFVPVFGVGWAVTSLAVTILLIRCFGSRSGTAALSTIWMLAGIATAGPSMAGLLADLTGGFALPLVLFGLLLLPVAFAAMIVDMAGSPRPVALAAGASG